MGRVYGVLLLIGTLIVSSFMFSVNLVTAKAQVLSPPGTSDPHFAPVQVTEVRSKQVSRPTVYIVRAGNTLSSIAKQIYGSTASWPSLWWINKSKVHNPNEIYTGESLKLSNWHPQTDWLVNAATSAIPAPAPVVVHTVAYSNAAPQAIVGSSGNHAGGSGYQDSVVAPAETSSYSGGTPGGAFGQCVVARESGGNAQVMNSSGHYGLYQFSESTWENYGGSASNFGNASVAQQEQVFGTAMADGGESNWSPYDGC